MTLYYAAMFIIPLLVWIGIAKIFLHMNFSWGEVAIQVGVTALVILGIFAAGSVSQTSDTKLVNGVVTELNPKRENCPMGWVKSQDGFCTEYRTRSVKVGESCSTNSNGTRTCTPIYDTEYNYDYSWEQRYFVETDINSGYEIRRVDSQGVQEPPRFSEIEIGDPVTTSVNYTNYIRGASESLFNETFDELPPIAYPRVRDYYRANRFIVTGVEFDSSVYREWNDRLSEVNSNIRETGANVIILVTGENQDFAEMMAQAWEAHNINDIVISVGLQNNEISWVDVRSWSDNSIVEVEIRDAFLDTGTLDIQNLPSIIENSVMDGYDLKSMEDFEYLADDIPPPTWAMIMAFIVLMIISPIVTFIFNKYEIV